MGREGELGGGRSIRGSPQHSEEQAARSATKAPQTHRGSGYGHCRDRLNKRAEGEGIAVCIPGSLQVSRRNGRLVVHGRAEVNRRLVEGLFGPLCPLQLFVYLSFLVLLFARAGLLGGRAGGRAGRESEDRGVGQVAAGGGGVDFAWCGGEVC